MSHACWQKGVLIALLCHPVAAQLNSVVEPTVIWRIADAERPVSAVGTYRNAFSHDGELVGVLHQILQVQVRAAKDGKLVAELNSPRVNGQFPSEWHDIAFSRTGMVALGGLGRVEIYDQALDHLITTVDCGACFILNAVGFSPDDRLLALQEIRALPERVDGIGSVYVIDFRSFREVARLEASTGRAKVAFSPDGERLFAMFTQHPAGRTESLGLKSWQTSDWTVVDTVASEAWTLGIHGRPGFAKRSFRC